MVSAYNTAVGDIHLLTGGISPTHIDTVLDYIVRAVVTSVWISKSDDNLLLSDRDVVRLGHNSKDFTTEYTDISDIVMNVVDLLDVYDKHDIINVISNYVNHVFTNISKKADRFANRMWVINKVTDVPYLVIIEITGHLSEYRYEELKNVLVTGTP